MTTLLQVFDMLESLTFYTTHLGFRVALQSPRIETPYPHINWVLLKRGASELMLNTAYEADERPARRDPARVAAHADTSIYLASENVDRDAQRLRDAGVEVEGPLTQPYGMRQIAFTDPDGYLLCFQQPNHDL